MIIRLSERLSRKIDAGSLGEMPLNEGPCADWTCRLFTDNRTQYVLISHTTSLYSCIMCGEEIEDRDAFVKSALAAIQEFMTADDQPHLFEQFVVPSSSEVSFAKALNRTVTDSMSDHVHGSKLFLSDGLEPIEVGLRLNKTPMAALRNTSGWKEENPREVFVSMMSESSKSIQA